MVHYFPSYEIMMDDLRDYRCKLAWPRWLVDNHYPSPDSYVDKYLSFVDFTTKICCIHLPLLVSMHNDIHSDRALSISLYIRFCFSFSFNVEVDYIWQKMCHFFLDKVVSLPCIFGHVALAHVSSHSGTPFVQKNVEYRYASQRFQGILLIFLCWKS